MEQADSNSAMTTAPIVYGVFEPIPYVSAVNATYFGVEEAWTSELQGYFRSKRHR